MKKNTTALLLGLIVCAAFACKEDDRSDSGAPGAGYKRYKSTDIPVEWTDRTPPSKAESLKIQEGDSFDKALECLGRPFQDSGEGRNIWHYRLDDGTYIQLIGRGKIEKILRYSNEDIK